MKKGSLAFTVMAVAILAGCSTKPISYPEAIVSTSISAIPQIEGQKDTIVTSGPTPVAVEGAFPLLGAVHVRVCNTDKSACNLGVGTLNTNVTVLALGKDKATIKVDLRLDIDKTTTVSDKNSHLTYTVSDDVPALRSSYSKSETVSVDYNRIGRFELPYGVAFKFCIETDVHESTKVTLGCHGPEVLHTY